MLIKDFEDCQREHRFLAEYKALNAIQIDSSKLENSNNQKFIEGCYNIIPKGPATQALDNVFRKWSITEKILQNFDEIFKKLKYMHCHYEIGKNENDEAIKSVIFTYINVTKSTFTYLFFKEN